MALREDALRFHRENRGKIEVRSKVPLQNVSDLSLAYTPGVAEPCQEIYSDPDRVYEYTNKGNTVAVVSNGTAVLGLGDIGPWAALPVMEGKAILFKAFAGIDAFPICLATTDAKKIVETVVFLEPAFGAINLEDIAAPACFEIEERLQDRLSIPVFHDDQHGTAIVTLAALLNAVKVVGKRLQDVIVVVNGAGAAGIAIGKMCCEVGVGDLIPCDRHGIIYRGRARGMNFAKEELARIANGEGRRGTLADALSGADVFVGVSGPRLLTGDMIQAMNRDPIVFALANPIPEIDPREALAAGAVVVGTGRSDYPNQINNILAFPGVLRGALNVRASCISPAMKLAAAHALAGLVPPEELTAQYVVPRIFTRQVAHRVAAAVAQGAMKDGVARINPTT